MSKKKDPKTIQIVMPKNKDVVNALKIATTMTGFPSMSQFILAAAVDAALTLLEDAAAAHQEEDAPAEKPTIIV